MNKKISPTLIGVFVVGAVALMVIAILVFGSGRLFRQSKDFVLYFDNSVNGLHIGAPVKIKGVEIGSVKDIRLQLEQSKEPKIPVIVELDLEKFSARGAASAVATAMDPEALNKAIVDRGLRGQLEMESLVTGLLFISLDFFPGTPITLVQSTKGDYKYPEIPTLPTSLEQAKDAATRIINKLEEIDFKELGGNVEATLKGVNRTVNSPEIESVLRSLAQVMPKIDKAVVSINTLSNDVDGKLSSLSDNLAQTSDATRQAMNQAANALKQTDAALKAAEGAMTNIKDVIDPESPTFYEIGKSLREVSAAARALRLLGNYIERNPRALIFGKPENQEGK
jgi:phospholipid/cholesterol/gamma-HCH transport system substrate-binding protein